VLLKGWCLAVEGKVAAVRLRCGAKIADFRWEDTVTVHRPDVIEALGARYGRHNADVGFIAFCRMSARG
jgi:hypothetical protein